MKFKVMRPLYGDNGLSPAGSIIDIPNHMLREYEQLEASGIIQRQYDRPTFKAYAPLQNKALRPLANK